MARKLNRRQVLGGIGATGAVSVAGCLNNDNSVVDDDDGGNGGGDIPDPVGTDPDERDVMHGILIGETGALGELGPPIADGGELPSLQLENEGSAVTVDIQREDTQTASEAGISGAESLVAGGYPSITGAAASNVTTAVAESVAIPENVPLISPASTTPGLSDVDGDYMLRTCPSDALQGAVMAQIAYEDEDVQSAAVMYQNDAYGQALASEFEGAFEDLGGEIVANNGFEPEQASYTSVLESSLQDDPELLMVVTFPESGAPLFRDFYSDYDNSLPVMVTDGLIETEFPNRVDNPMNNVIGTAPSAAGPEVDAFNTLYEDEFGTPPGQFNAHAYDASAVQILANLRGGENNGETVSSHIRAVTSNGGETVGPSNFAEAVDLAADGEEVEYRGASSPVVFNEDGDITASTYDLYEFGDYEYEITESIDFEA